MDSSKTDFLDVAAGKGASRSDTVDLLDLDEAQTERQTRLLNEAVKPVGTREVFVQFLKEIGLAPQH